MSAQVYGMTFSGGAEWLCGLVYVCECERETGEQAINEVKRAESLWYRS